MKKITRVLLVILSLAVLFTGCSNASGGDVAVTKMFDNVKKLNFEKAQKFLLNEDIGITKEDIENGGAEGEIIKKLIKNLEYEVLSVETKDENTVIVHTNVKTIDVKKLMADFMPRVINHVVDAFPLVGTGEEINAGEKINEDFSSLMQNPEYATYQQVLDITVINVDNGWKIDFGDSLKNVLYKNVKDVFDQFENTVGTIQENTND